MFITEKRRCHFNTNDTLEFNLELNVNVFNLTSLMDVGTETIENGLIQEYNYSEIIDLVVLAKWLATKMLPI